MKNLLLLIPFLFFGCSSRDDDSKVDNSIKPFTYNEAMSKIGLNINTFYNYSGLQGSGKVKFDNDLNITEVANGQTVVYKYNFESNNQQDLTMHFSAVNKDAIPQYSPKMPITSLAKHFGFSVSKVNGKIQISGLYSYNDSNNIFIIE